MQELYVDTYEDSAYPNGQPSTLATVGRWLGAAVSIALLAGMAVWIYHLGKRDATEVPIIKAMAGPSREQPLDPGGAQARHQGLAVNAVQASGTTETVTGEAQLAPAVAALLEEDKPTAQLRPVPRSPELERAAVNAAIASVMLQSASVEVPEVAPAPAVQLAALTPEGLTGEAGGDAAPRMAFRPLRRPATLNTSVAVTTDIERQLAGLQRGATMTAAEISPGTLLIQVGAFDREEEAADHWEKLVADHEDLLGLKSRVIQKADSSGRVFYRLRAAGFNTLGESSATCAALEARRVPCIPFTAR
jgi:hypothetical protein